MRRPLVCAFCLCAATLAVFAPALRCAFVAYDDDLNVCENPHLAPPSAENTLWFWLHPYQKLYVPLTYTAWSALAALAGSRSAPLPFHLLNLLLHAANACLVFLLLRLSLARAVPETGPPASDWAALAGSLLFALHPVQVEPVVWVSGLKDVLCGFFSLLSLLEYLRYAGSPGRTAYGHYAAALTAFAAALLAKPSAVAVPLIAFVLDAGWEAGLALTPWLALSAAAGWVTHAAQPISGIYPSGSIWPRLIVAGDAISFYLFKLAYPRSLAVDYGRTPRWVLSHGWCLLTFAAPVVLAGLLSLAPRRRLWLGAGAILAAWLLPVLGLLPFDHQLYSTVADRYLYVGLLGPAFALAAGCALLWRSSPRAALALAAAVLLPAGAWSAASIAPWKDSAALFAHWLAVDPGSSTAHDNLGYDLERRGRPEEAELQYLEAVQLNPEDGMARNSLGNLYLARRGNVEAARREYALAVASGEDPAAFRGNLGVALAKEGRRWEALEQFRLALRIAPGFSNTYNDVGNVLLGMKAPAAARGAYEAALLWDPASQEARSNLDMLNARLRGERP